MSFVQRYFVAADDALTLLRIHRGTLYNARAACKMVCEAGQRKILLRLFHNRHLNGLPKKIISSVGLP
jgi:hypothetical protein